MMLEMLLFLINSLAGQSCTHLSELGAHFDSSFLGYAPFNRTDLAGQAKQGVTIENWKRPFTCLSTDTLLHKSLFVVWCLVAVTSIKWGSVSQEALLSQ
jgi:hypothetical protein